MAATAHRGSSKPPDERRFAVVLTAVLSLVALFWAWRHVAFAPPDLSLVPAVRDDAFEREVLQSPRPVLVLAGWRDRGDMLGLYGPILQRFAAAYGPALRCRSLADSGRVNSEGFPGRLLRFEGGRETLSVPLVDCDEPTRWGLVFQAAADVVLQDWRLPGLRVPMPLTADDAGQALSLARRPALLAVHADRTFQKSLLRSARPLGRLADLYVVTDPVLKQRYRNRMGDLVVVRGGRMAASYPLLTYAWDGGDPTEFNVARIVGCLLPHLDATSGLFAADVRPVPLGNLPGALDGAPDELATALQAPSLPAARRRGAVQGLALDRTPVALRCLLSALEVLGSTAEAGLPVPDALLAAHLQPDFPYLVERFIVERPFLFAVQALGRFPPADVHAHLAPYLRHENQAVRAAAAAALDEASADQAAQELLAGLASDRDPVVRQRATTALARRASAALLSSSSHPLFSFPSLPLLLLSLLSLALGLSAAHRALSFEREQSLSCALACLRRDDYDLAARSFLRHLQRWPKGSDRAWLHLAITRLKQNLLPEATSAIQLLDPAACPADELCELAAQAEARGQLEPAAALYRHLVARGHPDARRKLTELARLREPHAQAAPAWAAGLLAMLRAELPPHYASLEPVGQGGMGAVFGATDTRTGARVAVKVLDPRFAADPEFVRRFYREVVAAANLTHPGIPRILDVRRGSLPCYVMEFADGRTLDQLVAAGPMPPSQAVDVAVQLASALACAHRAGVVHRDVKPHNVVLAADGAVKLLDFGVAHLGGPGAAAAEGGQVLGTPLYMAPEQLSGQPADARADVYALGSVLFELLAGRRPFGEQTPYARLLRDPDALLTLRPELPPPLAALVHRCLARAPADRPKDAGEVLEALKALPGAPAGRA